MGYESDCFRLKALTLSPAMVFRAQSIVSSLIFLPKPQLLLSCFCGKRMCKCLYKFRVYALCIPVRPGIACGGRIRAWFMQNHLSYCLYRG